MQQVAWVPTMDDASLANIRNGKMVTGLAQRIPDGWDLSETFCRAVLAAGATDEAPGFIVWRCGEAVVIDAFKWPEFEEGPPF